MKNIFIIILSVFCFPISAYAVTQDAEGQAYGGFADAYFPGGADLPLDKTKRVDLLGIEADLSIFSLGCNSLEVSDIAASYKQEFEEMGEYYKDNWSGLALNYLIYRNPTLYQLIVENMQGFREVFDSAMMTCQSVREAASEKRESDAVDKCIEENGASRLCNMKYNEYASKLAKEYRKKLEDTFTASKQQETNNNGGGSTPPKGNKIVNATMAQQYGMSSDALQYFDELVPPLQLKDDSASDEEKSDPTPGVRRKKLGEILLTKQQEYAKTLDDAVNKHLSQQTYAGELTTIVQSPYMYSITPEWIEQMAALKNDKKFGGVQYYNALIAKMSRKQALAQAQHMVAEFEMAMLNLSTSGKSSEAIMPIIEKYKQHYGDSVKLLKAHLDAEAQLDKNIDEQRRMLKAIAEYNKAKGVKFIQDAVPQ